MTPVKIPTLGNPKPLKDPLKSLKFSPGYSEEKTQPQCVPLRPIGPLSLQ